MAPPTRTLPAAFFGMILGLVGLGSNWRVASRLWGLPPQIGEGIMAVAFVVWAVLTAAFWYKWIAHRDTALEEARHPINCCFIGLAPSSTVLMAVVLAPHARTAAMIALIGGALGQVAFGVWRFGGMLQGDRDVATTTPVIYLPSVAGNFIIAIGAGTLGFPSWGILFFGVGLFSWFALESIVVFRLLNAAAMPPPLRPTIGIQLAPPVVAAVAWLANTQGYPDLLVQAAWGYGLIQLLLALRLAPWIAKQPFVPAYWAFSFGITALSGGALQMSARGLTGAIQQMAPILFVFTNVVMAALVVGTLVRMAQGRLLPPAPAPVATAP